MAVHVIVGTLAYEVLDRVRYTSLCSEQVLPTSRVCGVHLVMPNGGDTDGIMPPSKERIGFSTHLLMGLESFEIHSKPSNVQSSMYVLPLGVKP